MIELGRTLNVPLTLSGFHTTSVEDIDSIIVSVLRMHRQYGITTLIEKSGIDCSIFAY